MPEKDMLALFVKSVNLVQLVRQTKQLSYNGIMERAPIIGSAIWGNTIYV